MSKLSQFIHSVEGFVTSHNNLLLTLLQVAPIDAGEKSAIIAGVGLAENLVQAGREAIAEVQALRHTDGTPILPPLAVPLPPVDTTPPAPVAVVAPITPATLAGGVNTGIVGPAVTVNQNPPAPDPVTGVVPPVAPMAAPGQQDGFASASDMNPAVAANPPAQVVGPIGAVAAAPIGTVADAPTATVGVVSAPASVVTAPVASGVIMAPGGPTTAVPDGVPADTAAGLVSGAPVAAAPVTPADLGQGPAGASIPVDVTVAPVVTPAYTPPADYRPTMEQLRQWAKEDGYALTSDNGSGVGSTGNP